MSSPGSKGFSGLPNALAAEIRQVLSQIKERIEIGEGQRGDPMQQYVKLQMLQDLGLAKVIGFTPDGRIPPGGVITPPPDDLPDLAVPPQPTGFNVVNGFSAVILDWDPPGEIYGNHAKTLIFRATVDDVGQAVVVGESFSFAYADLAVQQDVIYYYWIAFESTSGVQGPYNSTAGTQGWRAADPEQVLADLTGQITETQLHADLNARINLIDGPPELLGSVAKRVQDEADARAAAILAEASTRNTAIADAKAEMTTYSDSGSASAIRSAQLVAAFGGNAAQALDYTITEVDTNSATATTLASLKTQVEDPTTGLAVKASVTELTQATTVIDEFGNAKAIVQAHNELRAQVNESGDGLTMSAVIAEIDSIIAGNNSIAADSLAQLSTTVGGNTATVEEHAQSIDGLEASYTIKVQTVDEVTGKAYVAGYGLAMYPNELTGGRDSYMEFLVDYFSIGKPGSDSLTFVVDTTKNRVVMDGAFIKDLTVTNAAIQEVGVDKISGLDATFISARIVDGSITNAKIGNVIQSDNYGTTQGWQIRKDTGGAIFRNITITDAAGNVILASGNGAIQYAALAGLPTSLSAINGSEATKLASIQAGADKTSLNTAAGIANQGKFATLNQINSGNIGTYIASAAIGAAYIQDLAVSTLKIQDNAVTVPVSLYIATETLNPSPVIGDWIANHGQPVTITVCFEIAYVDDFAGQPYRYIPIIIRRDGVIILSLNFVVRTRGVFELFSFTFTDDLDLNSYYYYAVTTSSGVRVRKRSLNMMVVRK